jgi:hypothetical protein
MQSLQSEREFNSADKNYGFRNLVFLFRHKYILWLTLFSLLTGVLIIRPTGYGSSVDNRKCWLVQLDDLLFLETDQNMAVVFISVRSTGSTKKRKPP